MSLQLHFYVAAVVLIAQLVCDAAQINTKMAGTKVPESFMEDNCQGESIEFVDKSLKVTLLKEVRNGQEIDCSVSYSARRPSERVLVTFEKIHIDSKSSDRLHIYDGPDDHLELTKPGGLAGDNPPKKSSYRSKYYKVLTLRYTGTPTDRYNGFIAILTVTNTLPSNGTCSPEYFHCVKDKYCIAEELQCNGYNNCGNGTDEESCMVLPDHTGFHQNPGTDAENLGMLVGGSVSILILLIVAVWLGIVCVRRIITKREFERREHIMVSGPVIDADNVPPVIHCSPSNRPHLEPFNTRLQPPPLYSEHNGHGRFSPYELPPPYTPDGCDTAVLLNQTQLLSLDTPPAYRTIDPNFEQHQQLQQLQQQQLDSLEDRRQYTYMFPDRDTIEGDTAVVGLMVPAVTEACTDVDNNGYNACNHIDTVNNNNDSTLQMVDTFCQVGDSLTMGGNSNADVDQTMNSCQNSDNNNATVTRNNTNILNTNCEESLSLNPCNNSDNARISSTAEVVGNSKIRANDNCLLSDSIANASALCLAPINHMSLGADHLKQVQNNSDYGMLSDSDITANDHASSYENNNATDVNYYKRPKAKPPK